MEIPTPTPTRTAAAEAEAGKPRSSARHVTLAARLLLGLLFFVFGLNGFLHFIPEPKTPMPAGAVAFAGALMQTHYMFPMIMGTQLLVGIMLLLNVFVPLALALIVPVIVNIIAFHLFLQPSGLAPGAVALALELYLAWAYRKAYSSMLAVRVKPH